MRDEKLTSNPEAAKQAEEDAAAAGNETANANEGEGQDENLNEEEQAKADEEAKLAEEGTSNSSLPNSAPYFNLMVYQKLTSHPEAAKQAEGEDAAANEEDAAAASGEGEGEKKASAGRKASEKMKMKKSTIVQRSAAGKRVPGMGKMKVVGSVGFAAVMGALVWGL